MTIPKPRGDENENEFISRCMSDSHMKNTYSDKDQRLAVCFESFRRAGKTSDIIKSIGDTLTVINEKRKCKKEGEK